MKSECKRCGTCCKGEIGPLLLEQDLLNMAREKKLMVTKFIELFCERQVVMVCDEKLELIFLKMEDGHCILLNENNLCSIYKERPYQCKNAPFELFGEFKYWHHMKCIEKKDFENVETKLADIEFLKKVYKYSCKIHREEKVICQDQ